MAMMLLGLLVFLGTHMVTALPGVRERLIASLGEGPYKGFYSLLSVSGLLLTAYGYGLWRASGPALIWDPPPFTRHITVTLMLLASICAVAAYVPSHIRTALKHPLLVAVKTWAVAHLISNGDLASIVLFGAFLAWAVFARIAAKRRGAPIPPAPQGWRGDVLAVVGGLVAYAALTFLFHPYVVGVRVMG